MFRLSIYLNTSKKPEISVQGNNVGTRFWITIEDSDSNDITIFLKTKEQAERVAEALRG